MLQAAGEVADGVIIGGLCTADGISYALDQVDRGAAKTSRDISKLRVVSWVACQVTSEKEKAINNVKPTVAHIIGGAPMTVLEAIGLPADLVQDLKRVYHEKGIADAALLVTDDCIRAFTIIGDANECADRIKELESAGVTQFSTLMYQGSYEQHRQTITDFAQAIFPSFR